MTEQDIFIIEAAHDWVNVFVCSKKKIYTLGLKVDFNCTTKEFMDELKSIEKMNFEEINKNYDIEVVPFYVERWKDEK